jgi:hypothetical protein
MIPQSVEIIEDLATFMEDITILVLVYPTGCVDKSKCPMLSHKACDRKSKKKTP